jgi:hypothetical protein
MFFRSTLLEPPGANSRRQYSRIETRLLLAVMTSGSKAGPIKLSMQQWKAAIKLYKGIEDNNPDTHCTQLLRNLLLSLYWPEDSSMHATDIFLSPVVAFLALQCKTEQGAYRDISEIRQDVVMIQTCIRLHCLGHLMGDLQKAMNILDEGVDDNWILYESPLTFIHYADF